jgi:guanylate kinase
MSSDARAPGLLLVLSAPSGAGKTTLGRLFVAAHGDAAFSISATTRGPRGAERDGVDYHFVSPHRFAELVEAGAFAEWAEVHGQRYGTLRATVAEALAAGRVAVFDIDVQGGMAIKRACPREAVNVFVLPPSMEELERRLRTRSTDSEGAIAKRLAAARDEISRGIASYDYAIVNESLADARRQLDAIVACERARLANQAPAEPMEAIARSLRAVRVDVSRWLSA